MKREPSLYVKLGATEEKGGSQMQSRTIHIASQALCYIEAHLQEKQDLDQIASALHYSRFHLHRLFTKTVGMTLHDYVRRRQLTEGARRLAFSQRPILEIAQISGYESQQAFTDIFKAMYKTTPAEFRRAEEFYPLQLAIHLRQKPVTMNLTKDNITLATPADVQDWMELVSLTIDGYPCMNKTEYMERLYQYMDAGEALILRHEDMAVGAMGFSAATGSIDFLAIHPQYRKRGITKLFLDRLADELPDGKEITVTTYRAGDKADTGYRDEYCSLGFAERELLVEYGYPVQRFVLLSENKEEDDHERNTEKPVSGKV